MNRTDISIMLNLLIHKHLFGSSLNTSSAFWNFQYTYFVFKYISTGLIFFGVIVHCTVFNFSFHVFNVLTFVKYDYVYFVSYNLTELFCSFWLSVGILGFSI